jgi:DNA-binding IclR family transcriptional regulator
LKRQLSARSEANYWELSHAGFQRVSTLDKCFAILDLIIGSGEPLGVSEISRRLRLNKSTVFNIVHTLAELEVLEHRPKSKLAVGTRLYVLGKAAGSKAELVHTVHPYLRAISSESKLSAFLAVRWGMYAVIVDKVEDAADVRVSYEIGIRLPLFKGVVGKALLCQLSDAELDNLLRRNELARRSSDAYEDKMALRNALVAVREEGIAADPEEQVKGIVALAAPINVHRANFQAAIVAVGLKWQWHGGRIVSVSKLLKQIAVELDYRFSAA